MTIKKKVETLSVAEFADTFIKTVKKLNTVKDEKRKKAIFKALQEDADHRITCALEDEMPDLPKYDQPVFDFTVHVDAFQSEVEDSIGECNIPKLSGYGWYLIPGYSMLITPVKKSVDGIAANIEDDSTLLVQIFDVEDYPSTLQKVIDFPIRANTLKGKTKKSKSKKDEG